MEKTLTQLYQSHFDDLVARHESALQTGGFDSLLIFGGAKHTIFLDDNFYPFKANPHFKLWAPILRNPNCFMHIRPGKRPHLLYFQPVDYWHKPAATPSGYWTSHFDITLIRSLEDAKAHIPANASRMAFIGEWDPMFEQWGISNQNPPKLLDRLHWDRTWKTPYEVACMREANALGVRGHRAAEKAFRSGASEYEIHLAFLSGSNQAEQEVPYDNIIALNENASVLHYQHLDRTRPRASERRSFLIDAGADFNGYASDITRTYSVQDDDFQRLIGAMERAQQELCADVRPGIDYRDLHLSTHVKVAEILKEFEMVDLEPSSIVEKGITTKFLPHGLGHFIGLQVHDVAGFAADPDGSTLPRPDGHPFLRLTRMIEERQSFTIEPGLYFIDSLLAELRESDNAKCVNWKRVDAFRPFGGIRIEDDVVVTESGSENLTREQFAKIA